MTLPEPRQGDILGFQIYPDVTLEGTLGDPEKLIWSSIKHLCVSEVTHDLLYRKYGVKSQRLRSSIAKNIKLYVEQASDLYEAAQFSKPNTAPLFYYYSFLNLAKARCEIYHPQFHKTNESYRHGLSWKPNPSWLVNMKRESVSIATRGIWHVLWEALVNQPCRVPNPTRLRVRDLFSYCIDTAVEYGRTYISDLKLIDLVDPTIVATGRTRKIWLRLSVRRPELRDHRLSRKSFLDLIALPSVAWQEVRSGDSGLVSFEWAIPKRIGSSKPYFYYVRDEIAKMNVFAHFAFEKMTYAVPIQNHLPVKLPQIMVLYTLMFWLSSLVRYDPQSVAALRESEFWLLIDGFMRQSQIRLLELFHWEFYRLEVALKSMR